MSDRIKCSNPDCERTILPSTAEKTGGLCMPCVQEQHHREHEKYVRENRKDVDLFAGIEDPVEIIKIYHQDKKYDPLINYLSYPKPIEHVYAGLSEHEQARLLAHVCDAAKTGRFDEVQYIALELAAFCHTNMSRLHTVMLDIHEYYPSLLFRQTGNEVVKKLLLRLYAEPDNRNHILCALAWAVNDEIINTFAKWINQPPLWANDLYIPPQDYARDAGWVVDMTGQQRMLYLDTCYPLRPSPEAGVQPVLSVCAADGNYCPWCKRMLTRLFEIDLEDDRFRFLPVEGSKLTLATCDACACYSDGIFMELDANGEAHWSEYNVLPDYLPEESDNWDRMPVNALVLTEHTRPADYAADQFLPTTFSQLGGMPTWIQDFAYPECPRCAQTMVFIAQIDNEDIDQYGEGIYYSYLCPQCRISATNYQQT